MEKDHKRYLRAVLVIVITAFCSGLKTMDIIDSKLGLEFDGEFKDQIRIKLHIKNYSNETQRFNISLGVPESLRTIISEPTIMLQNKYSGGAWGGNIYIDELIEFNYVPGFSREDLINTSYYYDNYELVIILNDSL